MQNIEKILIVNGTSSLKIIDDYLLKMDISYLDRVVMTKDMLLSIINEILVNEFGVNTIISSNNTSWSNILSTALKTDFWHHCHDIVNLYKRKGTVETLKDAIAFYGYTDSSLVEYWLQKNEVGDIGFYSLLRLKYNWV